MQIILASAKIMNDRVKLIPDISLSMPRFQNEAEGFARDMAQYSAESLTVDDLNVAQGKLWITSFLYGLLRPLDAILPYRMEGNVELPSGEGQNMFGFWKNRLTDNLIDAVKADDGVLIHLATEEYQHLFDWQRVRKEVRIVQPLFYVRKGNDLKMQAVWAKTCRGAMTRFIIENRIDKPEDLCAFSYEGFSYEPKLGEPDYPHFIKN